MFCELPRSADRTPYLVGLRRRRGSRACQTELIAGAQFYKEYALRSERFALGAERISYGTLCESCIYKQEAAVARLLL
jgi:hypothetical protein